MRILKFKNDAPLLFTSDIHAHHKKDFILQPRGFNNSDEALNKFISSCNSQSSNETSIIHLGDAIVGAGPNGLEALESLINQIVFKDLYLMFGNHWSGTNQLMEKADKTIDEFWRVKLNFNGRNIYFIPNYYEIRVGHTLCALSHYPLGSWNEMNKGSFMLHGHCHGSYKAGKVKTVDKGKILDVGIENGLEYHNREKLLFSFEDISNIMKTKQFIEVDHHV